MRSMPPRQLAGRPATDRLPAGRASRWASTQRHRTPLALWQPAHQDVPAAAPRPDRRTGIPPGRTPLTSGAGMLTAAVNAWPSSAFRTVVALRGEFTGVAAAKLTAGIRLATRHGDGLLLIHSGAGGASLLATFGRENPRQRCLSIEVEQTPRAVAAARLLAASAQFPAGEVFIDGSGQPQVTCWQQVPAPAAHPPLRPGDPVVITGGLGGLGRAVAIHLSRRFGAYPILVDRVPPGSATAQAALAQLRLTGRPYSHLTADVTDAAAIRRALRPVVGSRPVTALVHCAGLVEAGRAASLSAADIARLTAPKVTGLRCVLAALDPGPLRTVLAFGSILARRPHSGVGGYALANELLRREVDRWAASRPGPRYLTAEWSIWDGAGLAAETGAVGVARRVGYVPVQAADGLRMVERLLSWTRPATSLVISAESPASGRPVNGFALPAGTSPRGSR